jgi:hypothetical protein
VSGTERPSEVTVGEAFATTLGSGGPGICDGGSVFPRVNSHFIFLGLGIPTPNSSGQPDY